MKGVRWELGSCLGEKDIQLTAYFSCQDDFYFPVSGNGSHMPIFWIYENRMFGALPVENTASFCQVADEVTASHGATLEPESFFSGFPHLNLCLLAPADFPILVALLPSGFPLPL